MKKITKISVLFIIVLIVVTFGLIVKSFNNQSENLNSSHRYINWSAMNNSERTSFWLSRGAKKMAGISDAVEIFPAVKVPKNSLGRNIVGIIHFPNENALNILYERGIFITEKKCGSPKPPSPEELIKQAKDEKEAGNMAADALPELIEVSGIKGYGCEPGFNLVDSNKVPRPGVVSWYGGGIEYSIYGDDTSLDQLLEMAKSMYD